MDMQDKEFDQLFRSKLEDLEIEPSKSVWKGVNEGLGDNRRKRIIPFLSIAASIIVLIATGILFISKKDNVVKPHGSNRVADIKSSKVVVPAIATKPAVIATNTPIVPATTQLHLYHKEINNVLAKTVKQDISNKKESPLPIVNNQQVLAATSSSKTEIKQVTAIDSSKAMVATKAPVQNTVVIAAVPDKQPNTLPPAQKIADAPPVKRHGIHGLGDVLNVVIAAVDKRKDKIIEFGDSDGDGATVTGVNLGPIKIKKEN